MRRLLKEVMLPVLAGVLLLSMTAAVGASGPPTSQLDTDALANSGFETGNLSGWSTGTVVDFAGVVTADAYGTPNEGTYMARLGTPAYLGQRVGDNIIYQDFTVAEGAVAFAYNMFTYDFKGFDNFHYGVKDLATGSWTKYYSQGAWGSGTNIKSTGWQLAVIDLSGYIGKSVRLEISCGGTKDTGYATWAYLDTGGNDPEGNTGGQDNDGQSGAACASDPQTWQLDSDNLANPGFETGKLSAWSTGTAVDFAGVVTADGCGTPREGTYMARLGTPAFTGQPIGDNIIYQDFTVVKGTLAFAYNVFTYDLEGFDHFHYGVKDLATGSWIQYYSQEAWGSGANLKSTGWQLAIVDLSGYIGSSVRLEIDCGGTKDTAYPTWAYLDAGRDYQMERIGGPGDDGQAGSVAIESGKSAVWLADEKAATDVTWLSGAWVAEITTDSDWGSDANQFVAEVGQWDGSTFTAFSTSITNKSYLSGTKMVYLALQAASETVYKDNWLALRITNNDDKDHTVSTGEYDKASRLSSPEIDFAYPTPELPTVILLGVGLVSLAGYLGLRRRKALA